jgi:hypothetical protein
MPVSSIGTVKSGIDNELVQTSINLPRLLSLNLALWCTQNRVSQDSVIIEAITEYLRNRGLQPEREPKVKFTY